MPKISLYIHIPFCDVRCGYCSFVSDIYCRDTISAYLCHLKREADLNARYVPENISLKSIFFGGGTPSALSEAEIVKLFGSIYDRFNRDIGTEISFEANPESLTESKIRLLKQLGINRLSIGIQSFDEGILAYLGRVHSYQDAKAAFDSAKDADFDNVSIDLIYGIPYQTLDNWRHDIEEAVRLNPEHISIYCLSLEPEALLYKETPRNWPNDDLHSEMYYWARGALLDAGYVHYEISNFARPGRECRHNLSYWRDEEYLGLGVSAAFHWNGNRYKNADDISMYSSLVNRGDWPLVSPESSDEEREMRTAVVLGLRLAEGIDVAAFRNRFGRDIQEYYGDTIEKYVDDGRLILDGSKLHLSPKAYFISDGIFADLI